MKKNHCKIINFVWKLKCVQWFKLNLSLINYEHPFKCYTQEETFILFQLAAIGMGNCFLFVCVYSLACNLNCLKYYTCIIILLLCCLLYTFCYKNKQNHTQRTIMYINPFLDFVIAVCVVLSMYNLSCTCSKCDIMVW